MGKEKQEGNTPAVARDMEDPAEYAFLSDMPQTMELAWSCRIPFRKEYPPFGKCNGSGGTITSNGYCITREELRDLLESRGIWYRENKKGFKLKHLAGADLGMLAGLQVPIKTPVPEKKLLEPVEPGGITPAVRVGSEVFKNPMQPGHLLKNHGAGAPEGEEYESLEELEMDL